MQYTVLIAAAFILATIAVAALSPFDHLPERAPQQQQAKITPPTPEPPGAPISEEGSSDDDESDSEASGEDASSDEESAEDGASPQTADSSTDDGGYQAGVSSSGDPDEEPVGEYHGEESPE
jgi:hypothetical protein